MIVFKSSSVTTLKLLLTVAPPSSSNLPSANSCVSFFSIHISEFRFSSCNKDLGSFLNDLHNLVGHSLRFELFHLLLS